MMTQQTFQPDCRCTKESADHHVSISSCCCRFAAEGAKVGCADRDRDGLDATVQEIRDSDGQAVACEVDVTDEKLVEQMVTETSDAFGAVTVLYSNAGIAGSGNAKDLTLAEWDKVIAVNLTSVWLCSRACLPGMIEAGGGSIINQASVGGLVGVPGIASYAAAKAGDLGFTKALALETASKGITVNAIAPGYIATEMVMAVPEDVLNNVIIPQIPVGRLGQPEEIARCVTFLASDDAGLITGSTLTANGGQYMV